MKSLVTLLVFFISIFCNAQSIDAKEKMQVLLNQLLSTPKYECDITIKINVKFINMKERSGKMIYHSPDKIDYKIKGFAFLPKNELAASSTSLLSNDFVAIGLENQEINNQVCSVVKVIPIDIESTIVAGQFWINKDSEVCKMTFITKDKGSYTANLFYDNNPYKLPSKAIVTFDVKDQKLPALLTGDLEGYSTDEEFNEVSKGKIEINYFNYSID